MILGIAIVVLSFYTIVWHHQNYLLYKQSKEAQIQNQQIMAMHKQLLTDHSEKISGKEIKDKAIKILRMKPPLANNNREVLL
jgi:cell division protein FtsL